MIRLEVVDILPKHQRPKIFAEEFNDVERIVESGSISRESAKLAPVQVINHLLNHFHSHNQRCTLHPPLPLNLDPTDPRSRSRTYLSTNPCPTLYPKLSNRKCTASSSSSFLLAFESATSPAPSTVSELDTRCASGTSSMSRKSRHDDERKDALGSEELYGGETGSRDIVVWFGDEGTSMARGAWSC